MQTAMQQQINLYQPDDALAKEPFSATAMLTVVILTLLLMVSFYALLQWKKNDLEAQIVRLNKQSEQVQKVLEKLEATVNKLTDSKNEQQQLNYFKRVYASKQTALEELSNMVSGNSKGLSGYFSALARNNLNDVWFNIIDVYSGGEQLLLQGQTSDARSLPVLVNLLKEESIFKGLDFRLFKVQRDDKKTVLEFMLQTQIKAPAIEPVQ